MDEPTRAKLAELIAAHDKDRDALLIEANRHDAAAAALRQLLADDGRPRPRPRRPRPPMSNHPTIPPPVPRAEAA